MRRPSRPRTSARRNVVQHAFRLLLGVALLVTGTAHLSWARIEFQAQVPRWLPLPTDLVVVGSGLAECQRRRRSERDRRSFLTYRR